MFLKTKVYKQSKVIGRISQDSSLDTKDRELYKRKDNKGSITKRFLCTCSTLKESIDSTD